MKKNLVASVALFFISVSSCFSIELLSVEPNVIKMRHAQDVQFTVNDWREGMQLSITPGGAYIRSEKKIDDKIKAKQFFRYDDRLWVTSKNEVSAYPWHSVSSGEPRSERLGGSESFDFIAVSTEAVVLADDKRLRFLQKTEQGSLTLVAETAFDVSISNVSLSNKVACVLLDDNRVVRLNLLKASFEDKDVPISLPQKNKSLSINAIDDVCVTTDSRKQVRLWAESDSTLINLSTYRTTDFIQEATVSNGKILLATGNTGVTIIALENNQLQWLGSYNKLGFVTKVTSWRDERLMTADDRGVVSLFDISQPKTPLLISNFHLHEKLLDLAFEENIAYALFSDRVVELDFSANNTPIISTQGVNQGGSRRSFVDGNILYVADWFSGLHLYDISLPRSPRLLSSFHTTGSPKGVVVNDGVAFVADDDHGLKIIDVNDPYNPTLITALPLSGLAYTMKLEGSLLYIASHRGGVHIVDVTDVTRPILVSTYGTPSKAWALAVKGDLLYVADDSSGLMIFNVSDPANPKLVNQYNPGGFVEDVVLTEDKAYIAFFDLGLMVLDIRDPMNLTLLSHLPTPGNARGIEIHDDLLYLASWKAGVHIIDISDDHKPEILGQYDTKGATWGLSVKGGNLYAMDWWGGVKVLDVTDPRRLNFVGEYQTAGKINDILYHEGFIYTAHGLRGLQVYDASNSLNPVWATGLDFDGEARSLVLNNNLALIAAADGGLVVANVSNPFQVKWQGQIALPSPIDFVQSVGQTAFVATQGGDLFLVDITLPHQMQIIERQRAKTRALFSAAGTVFHLDDLGKLNHYSVNSVTGKWQVTALDTLSFDATFLTGTDNQLFIASESGKIARYNIGEKGLELTTLFHLPEALLDLHVDENKLYVTSKLNKLYVYDISREVNVQLQYVYPTTHEIARISVSKGAVFFSGEDSIASGKLLPEIVIKQNSGEYIAKIPSNMPLGAYNVNIISSEGRQREVNNAFKVAFPKFKSTFTLEDLKKKMLEKNLPGKAQP